MGTFCGCLLNSGGAAGNVVNILNYLDVWVQGMFHLDQSEGIWVALRATSVVCKELIRSSTTSI